MLHSAREHDVTDLGCKEWDDGSFIGQGCINLRIEFMHRSDDHEDLSVLSTLMVIGSVDDGRILIGALCCVVKFSAFFCMF